jgi:MFS family permease
MFLAATVTAISQLHRASLSALGPDVARELDMPPAALGAAGAAFFFALMAGQIPVGIALDRIGPRRLTLWLAPAAMAGAALQAFVHDGTQLWLARFLMGIGCSAAFMSLVVLCTTWARGAESTKLLTQGFAFSKIGLVVAGAPLAFLALWTGWRGAMLATAALTLAAMVWWWRDAQDAPPGTPPRVPRESLLRAFIGQFTVWATPGLHRLLCMHMVGYAAMATMLAIWTAPYLRDVQGLDATGRGWVLLAMVAGLPAGLLPLPRIERLLGGRLRTVVTGALSTAAILAVLALVPGLPLWAATILLVGLCVTSAYPVLVVAENRALFPDHMAGRAATTLNLAQVLGSAALPIAVGWVVGAWPETGGVRPEAAYRAGFGLIALALVAGAAGYALLPRGRQN